MSCSAKRCAYCPSPRISSHSAICCIGFTDIWFAVGRILDHGEETLSQCFRDSTSCSQQFARVGLRLFSKVVRQYGCSLPRSAWHDENNCTRPISAASSVARPDQCDRHRQLIERVHEPATKDCVTSGSVKVFGSTVCQLESGMRTKADVRFQFVGSCPNRYFCQPDRGLPWLADNSLIQAGPRYQPFARRLAADWHDGQTCAFTQTPNQWFNSGHPVPVRGAVARRHERGMGCGGRESVGAQLRSQGGLNLVSDGRRARRPTF